MIECRAPLFVVGWSLFVVCCSAVTAQVAYKWTDDRGVVHFADSPPPNVKAETRDMSIPSTRLLQGPESTPRIVDSDAGTTGPDVTAPAQGPARVIVISRNMQRTGASRLRIVGEVKNLGGAAAQHVAVDITIVEGERREPCLRQEMAVAPSTLANGASGTFDAEIDRPCLLGNPRIDVVPTWE